MGKEKRPLTRHSPHAPGNDYFCTAANGVNTKSTRPICRRALRLRNSFLAKRRHRQLAQRLFAILHTIGMFVADVARPELTPRMCLLCRQLKIALWPGTDPVRKCRREICGPYPVHTPCSCAQIPCSCRKIPCSAA